MNDQTARQNVAQEHTEAEIRGCGKIKYPSKRVSTAMAVRHARLYGGLMNAYRCRICKGWHIGHTTRTRHPREV